MISFLRELAAIQEHAAQADVLEVMGDLDIAERLTLREYFFKERSQLRDIPLTTSQLVDELPLGLCWGNVK